MKKQFISVAVLLGAAMAHGQVFIQDNFESYPANTWPSPWVKDGNANGDSTRNRVEAPRYETKSLRLYGQVASCLGALAYRPLAYTNSFEVEFDVYNGTESTSGCHPDRAGAGLIQGVYWGNPSFSLIDFKRDGWIWCQGQLVQAFATARWYHVRINYCQSGSTVKEMCWIDRAYKGTYTGTVNPTQQTAMNHFQFYVQEGSAWFDNLLIRGAQTADDFESYTVTSWPVPWIKDANTADHPTLSRVENDPVSGLSKVLKLYGDTYQCYGALAHLPFVYTNAFEVEFDVYNGSEAMGCHNYRGAAALYQRAAWQNPTQPLVSFGGDGTLRSGSGQLLQTYQPLKWYHLRINYYQNGSTLNQTYWVDDVYRGTTAVAVNASQLAAMDYFSFSAWNGSAWFDNLKVKQALPGYIWHNSLGYLYAAGGDWYYDHDMLGWMYFPPNGQWMWSSALQGWLAHTDPDSTTLWSAQFRWVTPSTIMPYAMRTTSIGPVYVGQYNGTPITEGWVVSPRFGYVWPSGDGVWFWSDKYLWLGVTPDGKIWCVRDNKWL